LLQSARSFFEQLQHAPFDYVLVDSPPVLPVADAQIMASSVQVVILVANAHKTPRRALVRAREELLKAHATLLGVVVNKSRWPDYSRDLEYPDDLERFQLSDSASLPAALPASSLQSPQISARQKSGDLWQSNGNAALHLKGQS
jgi:Mrp family chromosome partitioning ATPase